MELKKEEGRGNKGKQRRKVWRGICCSWKEKGMKRGRCCRRKDKCVES